MPTHDTMLNAIHVTAVAKIIASKLASEQTETCRLRVVACIIIIEGCLKLPHACRFLGSRQQAPVPSPRGLSRMAANRFMQQH
jgi:hypothetical protein